MPLLYILIAVVVIAAFYVISTYNWFQTAKVRISASIQEIGNQLKRQANLIPNLETSAKAYLKHEKDIYKSITDARKAVESATDSKDMSKISKAADQIEQLIPKLQVLVESNPEMKGAEVITRLMDELRDTSDKLTYARRVVIDLSADLNQRLMTFPTNIIGNMFGIQPAAGLKTPETGAHLEVSEDETKDQKISL